MDSVPPPVAGWVSDLTCNGQASPCRESFSTTCYYGSFLSKETAKPWIHICWMIGVNGRRGDRWTPQTPHSDAFLHINIWEQLPATPALCDGNMQLHSCFCKFLLYFAASVTVLLMPRHCMPHGAAQYENNHGDWASCPSLPACSSGVPSLPAYLSQEFAGVYGHSSNKKE